MTKKWFKRQHRAIIGGLILGVVVIFWPNLIFGEVSAQSIFDDSFDTYGIGILNGQGSWGNCATHSFRVSNAQFYDGTQSILGNTLSTYENYPCSKKTGTDLSIGNQSFWFYPVIDEYGSSAAYFTTEFLSDVNASRIFIKFSGFNKTAGTSSVYYYVVSTPTFLCSTILDTWHNIQTEWDGTTDKIRYKCDNNAWTGWVNPYQAGGFNSLKTIQISGSSDFLRSAKVYFDFFYSQPTIPELRVWGISPESGTTTATTTTNFTFGWEGWDFEDIYKDFVLSFYEKNTEIVVGSVIYEPTTKNGSSILPLSAFGFYKTGDYYFQAKARSYLYEYTAYYTTDLVSPEWWINLNVAGWTPVFEMPDWETWYSENSKFATSTAIFSGISVFLSPIFSKIGEFGDNVISFLNLDEAYDRGYDLGLTIPLFKAYVSEVEVFFGGFPIIQLFLAFLVILLGIFIVRLILKFIPGLG